MERRRAEGERGFIITLELVLIFTILGIGLLVGIVAIRNALFVWWQKKQSHTVWVYDSSDPVQVLGPVRDFDEHETPRLFFVDRQFAALDPAGPLPLDIEPTWAGRNFRAFIGVRDDRFTTRHRLFYTTADCSGLAACIAGPGEELDDNRSVGSLPIDEAGGIGYLYPLQGGPSYGIGSDLTNLAALGVGGFPGALYRSSAEQCDGGVISSLQSYWESQRVGYPCAPFLGAGELQEAVPVEIFNDSEWTPPFVVNLPPDLDAFTMLDPSGVEGDPGTPTNIPYDPSGDPSYDRVPDGEASPP